MSALARSSDPATSHLAAITLGDKRDNDQAVVLAALRLFGPCTDDELLPRLLGISPSGARTRRAELVRKGLVRDSGKRHVTRSNRQAIVWEVTPPMGAGLAYPPDHPLRGVAR